MNKSAVFFEIKTQFFRAGIFSLSTLFFFSLAYAAISWPSAPAGEVSGGKYSARLVPSGAIQAFNLATCPLGWVAADGSNSTPDLRGEFIRGLDGWRNVDTGRVLASSQNDAFQGHWHAVQDNSLFSIYRTFTSAAAGGTELLPSTTAPDVFKARGVLSDGVNGAPRIASETRPRNLAFLYCIKS